MSKKLIVKNSIEINASPAEVWDALVNPDKTKVYMFGCEALSEWKPGSPLLWQANVEGKDVVYVKGKIIEINAPEILKYTVIDPHADMEDIPKNYLNVTYKLSEGNGKTVLTVTQDGFENAADGEKRYKDTYNNGDGWNPILLEIKKLLEEKK